MRFIDFFNADTRGTAY